MQKDYVNSFATLKYSIVKNASINNYSENTLVPGVVTVETSQTVLNGQYTKAPQIMPAGLTSIPNDKDIACFMNMGAGQSNPYVIGYNRLRSLSIVQVIEKGETCLFSNYYAINLKNESLYVNYSKKNPQRCQLPIGEGYVMVSKDFIAQFEALITAHNNLVNFVNNHVHSGGTLPSGNTGSSTTSTSSISINSNISADKTWFDDDHALISEDGINLPH